MKIEKCFSPKFSAGRNSYFYNSYYDTSSRSFYTKDELEKYKSQIKTIFDNEGNGTMGKILYVGKGSNAPRHKIKSLVEENKIKKTTIIENSDTVIFDKKIINDVYKWFKNCKEVKITVMPFTKNLLDIINKYNNTNNSSHYAKQYNDLFSKKWDMLIYYNDYVDYPSDFKQALGNLVWEEKQEQYTYRTKNIQEVFDTIQLYFLNPHGNIIWDDNILETLNSDGIDLDDDYVTTLNSMFASNESDNIKLAVEMMANVNLNKYGLTIALLLNKWKNAMNWGNGNTGSQAYKILDRYFINKGIDWKRDYRMFSAGLYKNYSDIPGAKEIIEQFVLQNINRYLAEGGFGVQGCILQIDNFKVSLHTKK